MARGGNRTALWLALTTLLAVAAGAAPRGEYEVKAAFVLNFAHLVEWPESAWRSTDADLDVAVMAGTARFEEIRRGLDGRSVADHRVRVRRLASLDEIGRAHIVYLVASAGESVEDVAGALRDEPVLLIGEAEDFARRGGAINFYLENDRVRFEVNPEAARRAGLRVSSRLLSVARIVKD